ncbi:glycosyltransferase [Marinimicrococcus flavescens]|uniref:Glycosyltransferase n=1 Tax=Marinimicrococcus flavescens TaxID=3031815 RepID=A0AAP3UYK2_9PROT|nr:glycosyltransferase [Marinimicrococcus flavescens]
MRLVLFLPSFDAGGAQRQFAQLAQGLARRGHQVSCVALVPGGPYWGRLEADPGVRLVALHGRTAPGRLGLGRQWLASAGLLRRELRRDRPDVLYSALHAANLVAWLAARGGRTVPVAWGLRAARQDLSWRRRLPYALCAMLSPSVDLLVANSAAGLADHRASLYRTRNAAVVPNGIDVASFRPDPGGRARVRGEWGVPDEVPLVGLVGRLVPVKDHPTFLRAARILAGRTEARFVCVGGGAAARRLELEEEARRLGLGDRLLWAGERADMADVLNALDILCLPSRSEAFPNALAEAMACGVPCVATPVGDVPDILGSTGRLVPVGDPEALAAALHELLQLPASWRRALGVEACERIRQRYAVERMIEATERVLGGVVAHRAGARVQPAGAPSVIDRGQAP